MDPFGLSKGLAKKISRFSCWPGLDHLLMQVEPSHHKVELQKPHRHLLCRRSVAERFLCSSVLPCHYQAWPKLLTWFHLKPSFLVGTVGMEQTQNIYTTMAFMETIHSSHQNRLEKKGWEWLLHYVWTRYLIWRREGEGNAYFIPLPTHQKCSSVLTVLGIQ